MKRDNNHRHKYPNDVRDMARDAGPPQSDGLLEDGEDENARAFEALRTIKKAMREVFK